MPLSRIATWHCSPESLTGMGTHDPGRCLTPKANHPHHIGGFEWPPGVPSSIGDDRKNPAASRDGVFCGLTDSSRTPTRRQSQAAAAVTKLIGIRGRCLQHPSSGQADARVILGTAGSPVPSDATPIPPPQYSTSLSPQSGRLPQGGASTRCRQPEPLETEGRPSRHGDKPGSRP